MSILIGCCSAERDLATTFASGKMTEPGASSGRVAGASTPSHTHTIGTATIAVDLDHILNDEQLLHAFQAYVVSQYAEENLEFLIQLHQLDLRKAEAAYVKKHLPRVIHTFFGESSPMELNVTAKTKRELQENYKKMSTYDASSLSLLDGARREIHLLMVGVLFCA